MVVVPFAWWAAVIIAEDLRVESVTGMKLISMGRLSCGMYTIDNCSNLCFLTLCSYLTLR